jgi:hypothetical protein
MNTWITLWWANVQHYTTADFLTAVGATTTFKSTAPGSFSGDLAMALPQLRYFGVDINLLNPIVTWAKGIWPSYDWAGDLNATCVPGNSGTVICN